MPRRLLFLSIPSKKEIIDVCSIKCMRGSIFNVFPMHQIVVVITVGSDAAGATGASSTSASAVCFTQFGLKKFNPLWGFRMSVV